jgi:sugar O-acyltransferase (sialic acid O-acetyltransferase NeuD family)
MFYPYTIIGHSQMLGDIIDAIAAVNGYVSRVVQNAEDRPRKGELTLRERVSQIRYGVNIQSIDEFNPSPDERYVLGVGGGRLAFRKTIQQIQSKFGIAFTSLVHPSAIISPAATIHEGVFVGAGCVIASGANLAPFSMMNRASSLGHDSKLGTYAVIQPGAHVGGYVTIGTGATVGLGASVIERISVGDGAFVAAGAVVIQDVPDHALVAGIPAKVKKYKEILT